MVFCFDGDSAGRRAAWHALEVSLPLLADQKTIRFLFLPAEDDPDSYVRAHGKDVFEARLREAWPLSEFLLTELKGRVDMNSVEGRSRLIHEARPLLQKIAAPVMQLQMLKQLAEMAGMTQDEAARLCSISAPEAPRRSSAPPQKQPPTWQERGRATQSNNSHSQGTRGFQNKSRLMPERRRERDFLRFVMLVPDLAEKVPDEVMSGDSPESKTLAAAVLLVASRGASSTGELIELLRAGPEDRLVGELCEEILGSNVPEADVRAEFGDALVHVEEGRLDLRIQALMQKAQSGDGLTGDEREHLSRLLTERQNLKGIRSNRPAVV